MKRNLILILAIGILLVLSNSLLADAAVSSYSHSFTLRDYTDDNTADAYDDTDDSNGWYGLTTEWPGVIGEHFIEFDVSGIGPTVSASLSFDFNNISSLNPTYGYSHDISLAYYSGSNSTDMTLFGTGTFLTSVTLATTGIHSFNVDVNNILNNFTGNYLGFRFYDPVWTANTSVGDQLQFEGATLTTLVPEPISSALFIIGGVVLGGRSYMKRKKATSRA